MADRLENKPLFQGKYLGECVLLPEQFEGVEAAIKSLRADPFPSLNEAEKYRRISLTLLGLIDRCKTTTFLLSAILHFIDQVRQKGGVDSYTLSHFELWLNQHSGLSLNENLAVRAKIMGKWVPRDEYQLLFPIGMGKMYAGSHFVTAHSSPDLDTTIASFWGWVDAFAARVGEGVHVWNVPGGISEAQAEVVFLFSKIFGENIFDQVVKTRTSLSISSIDLLTQKGIVTKETRESSMSIDLEKAQQAVILVDEEGNYVGDWRPWDIERVALLNMLLLQLLRTFENELSVKLIAFFGKEKVVASALSALIASIFNVHIAEIEPVKGLTQKQRNRFNDYLQKVLRIEKGVESTFEEFAAAMKRHALFEFQELFALLNTLEKSPLFDAKGVFIEDRSNLFDHLEKIVTTASRSVQSVRAFVDRLEVALSIKTNVFGHIPHVLSVRADLDEIRSKMGGYSHLTVAHEDTRGHLTPFGVIYASDLHKAVLGTVTVRDFCNREETKIPSYLEVISVIDHHKSTLSTFTPPTVTISDVQSSNSVVASMAFEINDKFSLGGISAEAIRAQIQTISKNITTLSSKRILQRLLQRSLVAESSGGYFVDPRREFIEYLHFLYAIFEDTDLLTKVSYRDIEVVASLLNRLKSLMVGEEVEIIALDTFPRDADYVKKSAASILQHPETYSLYRKIYLAKEAAVEENLRLCVSGESSRLFSDTKEQNGCCRIGQLKLFAKNYLSFERHAKEVRAIWCEEAAQYNKRNNEVDLHLFMISTIASAEDLFAGTPLDYAHQDELWIWIADSEQATQHLASFLSAFKHAPHIGKSNVELELLGENGKVFDQSFTENFIPTSYRNTAGGKLPMAVLRFKAGLVNSRKSMISPYLPRLVT